jgi:hypothetical protein
MRIKRLAAKSALVIALAVAGLGPARAQEPPPPEECTGDLVDVEPSVQHCCVNSSCSFGREKKYSSIKKIYENPDCTSYDFHFDDIGCCWW